VHHILLNWSWCVILPSCSWSWCFSTFYILFLFHTHLCLNFLRITNLNGHLLAVGLCLLLLVMSSNTNTTLVCIRKTWKLILLVIHSFCTALFCVSPYISLAALFVSVAISWSSYSFVVGKFMLVIQQVLFRQHFFFWQLDTFSRKLMLYFKEKG
jgi:hypothetical protein